MTLILVVSMYLYRKQATFKPKGESSGAGFSVEAQKRIEEELAMRTGETDSEEGSDIVSDSEREIDARVERRQGDGASAHGANGVDGAADS